MGVVGLLGSAYLFMKQALLISRSRDELGRLIDGPGDKEFLNYWLSVLADSWRTPIVALAIYSLALVALSALLYVRCDTRCSRPL